MLPTCQALCRALRMNHLIHLHLDAVKWFWFCPCYIEEVLRLSGKLGNLPKVTRFVDPVLNSPAELNL